MKQTTTNPTQQSKVSTHWGSSTLYLVIILLALIISFNENTNAQQSPDWQWAKQMAGSFSSGSAITTDASGNVYTTGVFFGTVDFDPGTGPLEVYDLTFGGADDAFISKLDNVGGFAWAKQLIGAGGQGGWAIAVDASGNVYTSGSFNGTSDFDPGTGTYNLTATGDRDIYISKLDNAGNFVWAKVLYGNSNIDTNNGPKSMVIDPSNGDVYISGWLYGTADFDPGVGVFNLTSAGGGDVFICKLNSSGDFLWAKSWGSTNDDGILSMALDNAGNVYVPGGFQGTVDFDPGAGTFNLTSVDSADIFISKLNSSGNFMWAITTGGTGFEAIFTIAIDPATGDIYTAGGFDGTVDFDPGNGTFNLTSSGDWDIFILKLNNSGNFAWAKAMGGALSDMILGIAFEASANGGIYTTGRFQGTVDFDPGTGTINLVSAGSDDIFISKLDDSGNFEWAKAVGGTGEDVASSIVLDANGYALITGYFMSPSITFSSTNFTNTNSNWDMFIAKLDVLTGIENIEGANVISIYPNPANDLLVISYPLLVGKEVTAIITDITGKVIYKTTTINSEKLEINTSDFAEGVYLVQIQTETSIETKKIIVSK